MDVLIIDIDINFLTLQSSPHLYQDQGPSHAAKRHSQELLITLLWHLSTFKRRCLIGTALKSIHNGVYKSTEVGQLVLVVSVLNRKNKILQTY